MVCSHSISARLSKKLALFTIVVMGLLSWASWAAVNMLIKDRNAQDLASRCALFEDQLAMEARSGGEAAVKARLDLDRTMRRTSRLEVWRADGSLLHADVASTAFGASTHLRSKEFMVDAEELPGGQLRARYTVDYTDDAAMGARWALILLAVTLAAGAVVGGGVWWHVRRGLSPLRHLAARSILSSGCPCATRPRSCSPGSNNSTR
jgi:two-component system, OmpR family, heavy metal sensor histidine kinase CusS